MNKGNIILFDGVCNLCNTFVRFIIKRDKSGKFKFASLQSDYARTLLNKPLSPDIPPETVIYTENGKIYEKSTAVLKIMKNLDGFWKMFYIFILIPKPLRDLVYTFFAKRRYWIFGKCEKCIPTIVTILFLILCIY